MRYLSRATLATLLGLVLISVLPATSVWAWNSSCGSGEMCNYSNGPFGAPIAASSDGDSDYSGDYYPGTGQTLNDSVSSIKNLKSDRDAYWFFDANHSGTSFCLDAGEISGSLGSHNDKYSSHLIAANNSCPY